MKKIILKLLAPVVAWWLAAVDQENESDIMSAEIQPDPLLVPGFDAGIPTG